MHARPALLTALLCAATFGCAPEDGTDATAPPSSTAPATPSGLDPDLARKAEEQARATPPSEAVPQCEHVFRTRMPLEFTSCLDQGLVRHATAYRDCENKKVMYAVDDWGWGWAGEPAHRQSWAEGGMQWCYPSLYGLPTNPKTD